jgi:hypothetical protein
MSKIKQAIKDVQSLIEKEQPRTMEGLMTLVNNSGLLADYGCGYHIVQYMGYIQGVKVSVTGRKTTHYIPSVGSFGALGDMQKFLDAGWKAEYIGDLR